MATGRRARFGHLTLALSLALVMVLGAACGNGDQTKNTLKEASGTTAAVSTEAPKPAVTISGKDLPRVEKYIASCVNGPFREYTDFPDFMSVKQLPPVIFSGSELLRKAAGSVGMEKFARANYELYLQQHFNPEITLPVNADYVFGYDKSSDSFVTHPKTEERNFTPSSFWLDPSLSQEGNAIFFDAYEVNYDYVNAKTGREERDNPIARMVVDDVTIGFSAPIVRRDLHLIDYRPLAKTRYTLGTNEQGGFYIVSKTKLPRDEAYKASAQKMFASIEARQGSAIRLGGSTLNVRDWATEESEIIGTLEEGTALWFVNPLPQSGFYLAAPAAYGPVFDYTLGFGFVSSHYVG